MKSKSITVLLAALFFTIFQSFIFAHGGSKNVKLHVMNEKQKDKWDECSFKLDPNLTQKSWHQFTEEGGLVIYFRPLKDAKPMGAGNYEFSLMQVETSIDDTDDAWNDTFVHPDSNHWLYEGDGLTFPGLVFRAGITENFDAGLYWTINPNANYGYWGGQLQYNFINNIEKNWAASARIGFVSMFGPKDFDHTVYGLDVLASREYSIYSDWVSISPYAGFSAFLSRTHETTTAVNLKDENVLGGQAMVGLVANISMARLAVEYNLAVVNSFNFKIGVAF
ncbi:MAG: hypothetical protein HND50_19085 [Calditrichaeota bacterium]|nr:hypothetical protein [Calditrichota bacterium]